MRLLLAVGHAEMQIYISQEYGVDVSEVADNEQELFEVLNYSRADTLMLSRYLKGSDNPRLLIERIRTARPEIRIVYLYGVADSETEKFIKYLISNNITDYYVGVNISSLVLRRLLFGGDTQSKVKMKDLFKKKAKTVWFKELDKAVITIYSNSSNGKSHLAWNMASAFEKRGYQTTLINIDRGYSANLYFGIDSMYYDLLDYLVAREEHQNILDCCYKKGNLNIITGRLGSEKTLSSEDFLKFLYFARSKSDIVIIDTYTGLYDTTYQAINNSNIDFIIFDCDLMHLHLNKLMLEKLDSIFIENKTYAIINNGEPVSASYKYIYKQISKMNTKFKAILPLSSCGSLGCDLMNTSKTPYEVDKCNSSFYLDMNNILDAINARGAESCTKRIFGRGGS
ncbi:MAG: hypothetical protein A2Y23_15445 [Clostridiales bacterium GWB2_37_7]|nr:MAG: hypothetical protein A2Y23_15445 [Clostridiales bacterium GWB2_37_7]